MAKAPVAPIDVDKMSDAEIAAFKDQVTSDGLALSSAEHVVDEITGLTKVSKTGLVPCTFKVGVPELPGASKGETSGQLPMVAKKLLSGGHVTLPLEPKANA
jgi:hypothetical protein